MNGGLQVYGLLASGLRGADAILANLGDPLRSFACGFLINSEMMFVSSM
jgi:hypothetical protein